MTMTIRLASTIVLIGLQETNTIGYYGVPGNMQSLKSFQVQVERYWFRALRRRSQRDRMPWSRFRSLAKRWIPKPRIVHPYPDTRFDARHPR
jgi:RNA-directed DNA polymerase